MKYGDPQMWIREYAPRKPHTHSREAFVAAVNALVAIAGIPWWRAKAIIRWRKARGLATHVRKVLEPDGSATILAEE